MRDYIESNEWSHVALGVSPELERSVMKKQDLGKCIRIWMLYYVTAFEKDITCGWSLKVKIELCNTMIDSARLVAPNYGVHFVGRQSMIL